MTYETLIINNTPYGVEVVLNRIKERNAINMMLIHEFHQALDQIEKDSHSNIVIIKGQQNVFCTGMDFNEIAQNKPILNDEQSSFSSEYLMLLKRFVSSSKVIHSKLQIFKYGLSLMNKHQ